jgi:hypothetical protein
MDLDGSETRWVRHCRSAGAAHAGEVLEVVSADGVGVKPEDPCGEVAAVPAAGVWGGVSVLPAAC